MAHLFLKTRRAGSEAIVNDEIDRISSLRTETTCQSFERQIIKNAQIIESNQSYEEGWVSQVSFTHDTFGITTFCESN
jgi:hypothetical protein